VTKPDDIDSIVQETRIVITTVGPYWLWGTPVVQACVRQGRHYLDLSGETPWARDIITRQVVLLLHAFRPLIRSLYRFDYASSKSNTIIVPFAGLDSVPSDIVAYVANKTLKSFAGPLTTIDMSTSAWRLKGTGISGGTFSTIISSLETIPKTKLKAGLSDFALSPGKLSLNGM